MHMQPAAHTFSAPRHRVRELVCIYRPARDHDGRIVQAASLAFTDAAFVAGRWIWNEARRPVSHRCITREVLASFPPKPGTTETFAEFLERTEGIDTCP